MLLCGSTQSRSTSHSARKRAIHGRYEVCAATLLCGTQWTAARSSAGRSLSARPSWRNDWCETSGTLSVSHLSRYATTTTTTTTLEQRVGGWQAAHTHTHTSAHPRARTYRNARFSSQVHAGVHVKPTHWWKPLCNRHSPSRAVRSDNVGALVDTCFWHLTNSPFVEEGLGGGAAGRARLRGETLESDQIIWQETVQGNKRIIQSQPESKGICLWLWSMACWRAIC